MDASEPAAGEAITPITISVVMPVAHGGARRADSIYYRTTQVVACGIIVILAAIVAVLLSTAWPAIGRLGLRFFTDTVWNSTIGAYGALPFIAGTLITTTLALVIAVPISLAIAILLTEYAPSAIAAAIGVTVDVASGVPTIVFGAWALLAVVPWMSHAVEPAIYAVLGWLPIFSNPGGYFSGYGVLPTGLVLAAMVFPTIVSVTRNSFLATPHEMREASLGLGATRWETATRVVVRQARAGILGAIILACGRALGETMAVVYIIGTVPRLPQSLFDQGSTISAQLLTQVYLGGTIPGTLNTAALYYLGLILLLLSLATSIAGRLLTQRLDSARRRQ